MTKEHQIQSRLPAFAQHAWTDAEIRDACLELQDSTGADVALILAALWLAAAGRRADDTLAETLRATAGEWTPRVIVPLRAARRALKARDAALYARAQALELEAELRLLALLDAAAEGAPAARTARADIAAANLAALAGDAIPEAPAGRRLLARWSAAAPAPIESGRDSGRE